MNKKTEQWYTVSGDAASVKKNVDEFKTKHTVLSEHLSLQIMMLPAKLPDTKIVPLNQQQQMTLQPQQIVNAILVYEE